MNFYFESFTDFLALAGAYSTFMRVFYWHNQAGNFAVYGFPATMPFVLIAEDGYLPEQTLLAAFPSAIELSQSLDISGKTTTANNWADYKLLIDGITVLATPPQVTYYSDDGVYYFQTLDPATKTCLSCVDRTAPTGIDAAILAAYPSVVRFDDPVLIMETE